MSETQDFTIATQRAEGTLELGLRGELDMSAAEQLGELIERELSTGVDELRVDLRELSFIDSTGLRALLELDREAAERGYSLTMHPPAADNKTRRFFELTALHLTLPFDPAWDAAG